MYVEPESPQGLRIVRGNAAFVQGPAIKDKFARASFSLTLQKNATFILRFVLKYTLYVHLYRGLSTYFRR